MSLDTLLPAPVDTTPKQLLAFVESVDPLVITVDGDLEPLDITPSATVQGIVAGDKVMCSLVEGELIVTGIIDGDINYIEEFSEGIATAQEAAATADGKATTASSTASDAQEAAAAASSAVAAVQDDVEAASSAAAQASADAAQAAADAAAAAAAIAAAQAEAHSALEAANGKNRVFYPPNSPSGTLVAGDIWFKDANGTVEMRVYNGTDWVLSVVSDLNIPGINVNKLTGDTITGNFIIAGSLRTGTTGARVENDKDGIRVIDASEVLQTALGTDGTSTFKGQIEATGIEVSAGGQLKLNSTTNEIASGARLNIAGGVTAPSTTPIVTNLYPNTLTLKGPTGTPLASDGSTQYVLGVTWDATNSQWVSAIVGYSNDTVKAYRHGADGTYVSTIATRKLPTSSTYTYAAGVSAGVALIGTEVWIALNRSKYDTASFGWDWDGMIWSVNKGTTKTLATWANSSDPVHGPDVSIASATSTQCVVSYVASDMASTATVALYAPSTGTKSSTWATSPKGASLSYGNFDFGAARYLLATGTFAKSYTLAGVEQVAEKFPTPNGATFLGYDGTYIWSANALTGIVTKYDGPKWTSPPVFGYAWRDSKTAGTGVHESTLSPLSNPAIPNNRARLRITTAALIATPGDDGVDQLRVYGGVSGGPYYHQAVGTANQYDLATLATSGATAGQVAAFPATSPGSIQNVTGEIVLPGVGRAQLTGINVPASVDGMDMDTVRTTGTYYGNTMTNAAVTGISTFEVIAYSPGWVVQKQFYMSAGTVPEMHIRSWNNFASWSAWRKVASSDVIGFKARITTTFSLATNGHNQVTGYTELYDTKGAFTPSTGVWVVPTTGLWDLRGTLPFSSSSTGRRFLQFEAGTAAAGNSANTVLLRQEISGAYATPCIAGDFDLTAGTRVWMNAYQTSGSAMTSPSNIAPTSFSARWIGPTP